MLKELSGASPDGCRENDHQEKFGLDWHGKRRARQAALAPPAGTLLPCPDESVDWATTRNVLIEGDNLEVLKLLQASLSGKVKLIYIDPPYNTGKDFVYRDDYRDSIRNYLDPTAQTGGGRAGSPAHSNDVDSDDADANAGTSGRLHTNWLNMMYPRMKAARTLLHPDGMIFVSCDDGEAANLRLVLNEIYGEENFVAQFVWKARQFTDARATTNVSTDHEYILAYSREAGFSLKGVGRDETKFANPDNDPRGDWMSRSILGLATRDRRPNLHYDIVEPSTGRIFKPNPPTGWRYSRQRMEELIGEGRILFPRNDHGRPREKKFRRDMRAEFIAFRSIIDGVHTAEGTQEIRSLFGADVFPFPKPTALIERLVEQVTADGDIVMDFFAGSGTTGHAVLKRNAVDGLQRRYVLVQLPEPLDPGNREQKIAADFCDRLKRPRNIAELTKERLRRSVRQVREAHPHFAGDCGFRVFRLSPSAVCAGQPMADGLGGTLPDRAEPPAEGRT